MATATAEKTLLTPFEAARVFDLPLAWLEAEARAGRLPALIVGPTHADIRFHRGMLAEALAARAAIGWPGGAES